eukprot:scaffold918_cov168-Ochromonas_danica.AAC.10
MMQFSLLLPLLVLSLLLPNVKSQKVLYTAQFGSKGGDFAQAIAVRKSSPSSSAFSSSVVVTLAGELGGPLRFKKKDEKEKESYQQDVLLPQSHDDKFTSMRLLLLSPPIPEASNTSVRMFAMMPAVDRLTSHKGNLLDMLMNQSDGSIYMTGSFHSSSSLRPHGDSDIFLVKCKEDGSRLFSRLSGTASFDQGESLAMDSLGHVYVTGVTEGSLNEQVTYGKQDIFLLKYDWMGKKIWTKQYGTAEDDEGKSVAVDPLSQDIFMTGYTYGDLHGEQNQGNSDLFLLKVRSNDGTAIFTKLYGSTGFDNGLGILVDPSYGDVYISGSVWGDLEHSVALLMKYDKNGKEVWYKHFDPKEVSNAVGIAMNSQHCLYFLGYVYKGKVESSFTISHSDIVLRKYDVQGELIYSTSYSSGGEDYGRALTIDDEDNIYITGSTTGSFLSEKRRKSGGTDIFYMKISD